MPPRLRTFVLSVAGLLLCTWAQGCASAAAVYRQQAQAIGQVAASQTRTYIEHDPALLDRPNERKQSLRQVDLLERMTAEVDVQRVAAIEQAWSAVAPMFEAYVWGDPSLDHDRKMMLLAMARSFDRLNRAERGRQAAWLRIQRMPLRAEPN